MTCKSIPFTVIHPNIIWMNSCVYSGLHNTHVHFMSKAVQLQVRSKDILHSLPKIWQTSKAILCKDWWHDLISRRKDHIFCLRALNTQCHFHAVKVHWLSYMFTPLSYMVTLFFCVLVQLYKMYQKTWAKFSVPVPYKSCLYFSFFSSI